MSGYVKVAQVKDIPLGRCKTVKINGRNVALFHVDGHIYATADACPHEGVSLGTGGNLEGEVVTCGYHFWMFNVRTGASEDGMDEGVVTYPVKLVEEEIWVNVPALGPVLSV